MPAEPFGADGSASVDLEVALDVVDELLMAARDADQRARVVEALVAAMCDMDALLDPGTHPRSLRRLRRAAARLAAHH